MCSGSKQKSFEIGFFMGIEFEKRDNNIISILLELSSFDDLIGFKSSLEEECHDIDEASLWYGRGIGSKMMGFEDNPHDCYHVWKQGCVELNIGNQLC